MKNLIRHEVVFVSTLLSLKSWQQIFPVIHRYFGRIWDNVVLFDGFWGGRKEVLLYGSGWFEKLLTKKSLRYRVCYE